MRARACIEEEAAGRLADGFHGLILIAGGRPRGAASLSAVAAWCKGGNMPRIVGRAKVCVMTAACGALPAMRQASRCGNCGKQRRTCGVVSVPDTSRDEGDGGICGDWPRHLRHTHTHKHSLCESATVVG